MNIIIINNTSKESTVLKAFVECIYTKYKNIRIVFPRKLKYNYNFNFINVELCEPILIDWIKGFIHLFGHIASKFSLYDFIHAKKINKLNLLFLYRYYKSLFNACIVFQICERQLLLLKEKNQIFSMWYSDSAIAAAMIKEKYPFVIAASYAHSYEVDHIKNKYVGLIRDRYKEEYLDKIYFISEIVLKNYLSYNIGYLKNIEKFKTLHFGSKKKYNQICKPSTDGEFRILTVSGISEVKRLDILAFALSIGNFNKKIHWTIFGDGPLKKKIEAIISKYDNNKVTAIMRGKVNNDVIHDFYINNPVDLFINISSSEGLPVSIMEAMSYGVPTLATDVGGNKEIVNESTGLLIDANITPKIIADAINNIMIQDLGMKRDAAYQTWKDNYQIENNVNKLFVDINYKKSEKK